MTSFCVGEYCGLFPLIERGPWAGAAASTMAGSTHRSLPGVLCAGCCASPLFLLSNQLGLLSCVPCPWEAVHSLRHAQCLRCPSYPFVLLICWEKPEQSNRTTSLGVWSKTCCCDTTSRVLFSMIASFLGAFIEVCLNFNWFPLDALKFNWFLLTVTISKSSSWQTVILQKKNWWGAVTHPRLQSQCQISLSVNLASANHLSWWGRPSRDDICALGMMLLFQQQGWDLGWVLPSDTLCFRPILPGADFPC